MNTPSIDEVVAPPQFKEFSSTGVYPLARNRAEFSGGSGCVAVLLRELIATADAGDHEGPDRIGAIWTTGLSGMSKARVARAINDESITPHLPATPQLIVRPLDLLIQGFACANLTTPAWGCSPSNERAKQSWRSNT